MAKKYKIVYDRKNCIGAGTCAAVAPNYWKFKQDDGRVDLEGSELISDVFVRIIDESELKENLEAAQGCPAQVIHIYDLETGEQVM